MEERQLRLKANNVYIGSKIFECQYISKAFENRGYEGTEVRGYEGTEVRGYENSLEAGTNLAP